MDNTPANNEPNQEEVTNASDTTDESNLLVRYEEIINRAIELQEKISKGGIDATQEYAKLTEEMTSITVELQNVLTNLTPEEAQKFAELGQKWAEAAVKIIKKKYQEEKEKIENISLEEKMVNILWHEHIL